MPSSSHWRDGEILKSVKFELLSEVFRLDMNTLETSRTHAAHVGFRDCSAGCDCCLGDGSPGMGAGVGSVSLVAITHLVRSAPL